MQRHHHPSYPLRHPIALGITALLASVFLSGCASTRDDSDAAPGRDGRNAPRVGLAPVSFVIASMDTDRDYGVTKDELIAGIDAEWAAADSDLSGSVSPVELGLWRAVALGSAEALPSVISFDTNLDGNITKTEFDERLVAEFSQFDRDIDGFVSRSELSARFPNRGAGQSPASRAPDNANCEREGRGGGRRRGG